MVAFNDQAYFQQRAEAELELAQRATSPEAVAAHHQLAEAYLARAALLTTDGAAEPDAS